MEEHAETIQDKELQERAEEILLEYLQGMTPDELKAFKDRLMDKI